MKKVKVFLALDVRTCGEARDFAELAYEHGCGIKVGPELFISQGPEFISRLRRHIMFLDLKFHDIPSTMANSVRSALKWSPDLLTIHASAGKEGIEACVERAHRTSCLVIAVTCLTSQGASITEVSYLTNRAITAGADGVVCSGREVKFLREQHPEAFIAVPGIRYGANVFGDDQAATRMSLPFTAVNGGADALVVGRQVTQAGDPRQALRTILRNVMDAEGGF